MRIKPPFAQFPLSLFHGNAKLDEHAKIVWLVLATYANKEGLCWPCIKTIAADAGICERIVYRAIALLKKNGWLKVTSRLGRPSVYRLIIPKVPCLLESGNVPVPSQNEDSVQPSSTTPAPHADAYPQSSIHTDSTGEPLQDAQTTSAPRTDNLYPVPTSIKIPPTPKTVTKKPSNYSCTFDYSAGSWVMTDSARTRLENDWPHIDLEVELKKSAGWALDNSAKPIKNGLSFLSRWLSKPSCQRKRGIGIEQDFYGKKYSISYDNQESPFNDAKSKQEQLKVAPEIRDLLRKVSGDD